MRNVFAKILCLALSAIVINNVWSQKNFQPGYIITNSNDTTRGYIDFKGWDKNPTKIVFRKSETETPVIYTPHNTKKFSVANENFESAVVQIDKTPAKLNELSYSGSMVFSTDTVFLRSLVSGEKSLYMLKDNDDKEHFFIRENGNFTTLVHKAYLKDVGTGPTTVQENNGFWNQLNTYLGNCPSISQKLPAVSYKQESLVKLFHDYFTCTNTQGNFQVKTGKKAADFGLVAGVSSTKLRFKGADFPYLINVNYPTSVKFAGGVSLNLNVLGTQRKWSLYNEALYTGYSTSGVYTNTINANRYDKYTTEFSYTFIKINTLIRYRYPVKNIFLFANAGMANGLAIAAKNYKLTESKVYSTDRREEGEAIEGGRKYEQGFVGGVGAQIKKYSFELRYEKGNGMSSFSATSSPTTRTYLLLGYTF